ncbi:MAG: MarR family transcriptional regulator [Elusimicrobia bacterium]|nr:MarR family transcriptional regulator [Candidatus Liberimonas magnetica]
MFYAIIISAMKPQDILVLLKIHLWAYGRWTVREIADSIFISKSDVSYAVNRMIKSKLLDPVTNKVKLRNLEEFIIYGLPYVYPAEPGEIAKGIPTAYSAPPLKGNLISSSQDIVVWPSEDGFSKGKAVKPLHISVPGASLKDSRLYEMFVLIDALRIGRARDIEIAKKEIHNRLSGLK